MGRCAIIGGLIAVELLCFSLSTSAQIIPDRSLGAESSRLTPNVPFGDDLIDRIDGGAARSDALFHSFSDFNVNEAQQVYFSNPAAINHIFSRVTGVSESSILGTLGVLGDANLYLINPNGILFGDDAQLDVRGTFVGTTAGGVEFATGEVFSATAPTAAPLLTLNSPLGLTSWLPTQTGTIISMANLATGQNLMLMANDLDLTGQLTANHDLTLGASDTLTLTDAVDQPFIASAGNTLILQGDNALTINALSHPDSGLFSGRDMILRSDGIVIGDAHYFANGNFSVEQVDGSAGSLSSPNDPVIRASGDVAFDTYSGASLHILAGGSVEIDDITITGPDTVGNSLQEEVTLSNGTVLAIDGSIEPTVDIRAGTTAFGIAGITPAVPGDTFTPRLPVTNAPSTGADIAISNIFNPGGLVFLTNQYEPVAGLTGDINVVDIRTTDLGAGGDVVIDSSGGLSFEFLNVSGDDPNFFPDPFFVAGDSGAITLLADGEIFMPFTPGLPSLILSYGFETGDILIESQTSILQEEADPGTSPFDTSLIDIQNLGDSPGGGIFLSAPTISLGGGARAITFGEGDSGPIVINADALTFANETSVFTDTQGAGDSGNVTVNADDIVLINTFLGTTTFGVTVPEPGFGLNGGNAGDLEINANSLTLTGAAFLGSLINDPGTGDAGDVTINIQGDIFLDDSTQILSSSQNDAEGNAGNIRIDAETLLLGDEARVDTTVSADQGDSGSIDINTSTLSLGKNAQIDAGVFMGGGNSAPITIDTETLLLGNEARIETAVSGGNSGPITINARTLSLGNEARIETAVLANGDGGSIDINADVVSLLDSATINTTIETSGSGDAGAIIFDVGTLSLTNGATIISSVFGEGNAGEITIEARERVTIDGAQGEEFPSAIASNIFENATGQGGNITVTTPVLLVTNGGIITASTDGVGNAGSVTINTTESATFDGIGPFGRISSASVIADVNTTGEAGTLIIDAPLLQVVNGAELRAETQGGMGTGGNIEINADELRLDNQAVITAETVNTDGGNITLNLGPLLLLRNGSNITATAGAGANFGNGGNITITMPDGFIVAVLDEDSNIEANAFLGNGGNIDIVAQGLFGIEPQDNPTPFSDITASSKFGLQGDVTIETPDVDPSDDLVALPTDLVDASRLVSQGCGIGASDIATTLGEFTITGRGGLPPTPEQLTAQSSLAEWETLDSSDQSPRSQSPDTVPDITTTQQIEEFQGWIVNDRGEVVLTANATTAIPHSSWQPAVQCQVQSRAIVIP